MPQSNRRWMDLADELASDDHPGAIFLRKNLAMVRRSISDNPNGKLLLVPAETHGNTWQAVAGLTMACGCVHVLFMYVRPQHRNTDIVLRLFQEVAAAGKEISYGYVMLYCPLVDGFESLHDFCGELAQEHTDELALAEETVRIYCIPRVAFENVI